MSGNVRPIILAAGKGERMNSELPKVLHPLAGKPLICHVIDNLTAAGFGRPVVILGYRGEEVKAAINAGCDYAWQKEQLGTGHAVMQAGEILKDFTGQVIVACGDVPLVKKETYAELWRSALNESHKAVVLSMIKENPFGYGRIVRDKEGRFIRIVEEKDADTETKKIKEVNTGTYYFDKESLFKGLNKIDTNNAQKEYYLPDALKYIKETGGTVGIITIPDPVEGSGVNTQAELSVLEEYLARG